MKRFLQETFRCCRSDDRLHGGGHDENPASESTFLTENRGIISNGLAIPSGTPTPPLPQIGLQNSAASLSVDDTDSEATSSSRVSSIAASVDVQRIAQLFENGVKVSDHRYHLKVYPKCFIAREAVDFMVKWKIATSRKHAVAIGRILARDLRLFEHVCRNHEFKDEYLFFRFVPKNQRLVSIDDEIGCLVLMGDAMAGGGSVTSSSAGTSAGPSQISLKEVADAFEKGVQVKDNRYRLNSYKDTFVGRDAVDFLLVSGIARSREQAVELGCSLSRHFNLFRHVTDDHEFKDDFLFYKYLPKNERYSPFANSKTMSLEEIAKAFERGVKVKDHKYRLKTYKETFIGSKAVDFLVRSKLADSRREAVKLGRQLASKYNLFEHCCQQHKFSDEFLFYHYIPKEQRIIRQDDAMDEIQSASGHSSGMQHVANAFRRGVRVSTHRWRMKTYRDTFVGSEAVDFLVNSSLAESRKDAVQLGRAIARDYSLFEHVSGEHEFKDDFLFFRFVSNGMNNLERNQSFVSDITSESKSLEQIAEAFRAGVQVGDHKYHMRTYRDSFVGREAVDFLVQGGWAETRPGAVNLGRRMVDEFNLFEHTTRDHEFKDDFIFYRFVNIGELRPGDTSMFDHDFEGLGEIAKSFEEGVKVRDNKYHLRIYRNTFVGSEAVDFLVNLDPTKSREEAVQMGRVLAKKLNLFEHVCRKHEFKDEFLFYRFLPESERHSGEVEKLLAVGALEALDSKPESTGLLEDAVYETEQIPNLSSFRRISSESIGRAYSLASAESKETKNKKVRTMAMVKGGSLRVLIDIDIAERARYWSSTFRREDPRFQILMSVNDVTQEIAFNYKDRGIDRRVVTTLLRFANRASVFSVWRPTSFDAIRKMMLGEATGKGLDIKGKSAKRGKLSAFVPFLQISENIHKKKVRPLPKDGRVRLFFKHREARDIAAEILEDTAGELIDAVQRAKVLLTNDKSDQETQLDALECMLLDVTDPSICYIDEYAPQCYGIEFPVRWFWEAFFVRQDCTRKPGSEYDTGRPSVPAFQDMNFAALRGKAKDGPRAVVFQQGDAKSAMSPFELVMAYEENGRVLPVVSDFDCFLVGTKGVNFSAPLPPDELDVLKWCVSQIERILDDPPGPDGWTSRWLEVLKEAAKIGFHPRIPRLGFGDPTSYNLMEDAIQRLANTGPVRHGAECFNYFFPQDLDEEYLIICDSLPGKVPWKYVGIEGLLEFLSGKIDEGFTFPLNPKHILCDAGGWKDLYDKLMASEKPHVQESLDVWYPLDSGVRGHIEAINERHPEGFQRRGVDDASLSSSWSNSGSWMPNPSAVNKGIQMLATQHSSSRVGIKSRPLSGIAA